MFAGERDVMCWSELRDHRQQRGEKMKAVICHDFAPREQLRLEDIPSPVPGPLDVLVRVEACGVCRTDLHVVDGALPPTRLPLIPGHEIVGLVEALGPGVDAPAIGTRVGVPWLGHTDGTCP